MCGRTACTLDPENICQACSYRDGKGKSSTPDWKDAPDGRQYYPSYNVAPTSYTPVMFSKKHVEEGCEDVTARLIQPMRWGMVPFWHKGDVRKMHLETNNARSETLLQKTMFKVPMKKGRRCVVLADGYYEWKELGKDSKQPYFIYFPQPDGIKIEDHSWTEQKVWSKKGGWKGPRLFTMAGVFDIWKNPVDDSELYSYSVITMDAASTTSWIHERMPAILDGDEAVEKWLDFSTVSTEQAMKLLVPVTNLTCHPVSTAVGNSRNKSPDCMQPINLESKSANFMKNWLKKGSPIKRETTPKREPAETRKEDSKPSHSPKNVKREKPSSEVSTKKIKREKIKSEK